MIDGLVTGFQYGINSGVGWFSVGGLGTYFYWYSYGINLSFYEGIELGLQIYIFRDVVMTRLSFLWQES